MAEKRFGGVPPIVTVLITISAVVAAGIAAWFLFTTTSSAVKTPILEVTEAYYVGTTLFITVKNLGASDVTVTFAKVDCERGVSFTNTTYSAVTIPRGSSTVVRYTSVSNIRDGDLCVAPVTITSPTSASVTLQFRVVRP